MTPHWAIETIARHVIYRASQHGDQVVGVLGLHPRDWDAVVARVRKLTPAPDPGEYAEAYALLAGRADPE